MNVCGSRLSAVFLTTICVTSVVVGQDTRNAVPVNGAVEFLDVVTAAIKTARSRYPQGKLSASVSFRATRVLINELIWSGNSRYVDFETYDFDSASRRGEPRKGLRKICIDNDREILTWVPSHKIVARYPHGAASLPYEVRIAPRDNWFMFQDTSIVFERMFDAAHPQGAVSGFTIERKAERVFVTRKGESDGQDIVFEFSLEQAGLPVSYRTKKADRYTGEYEWRKGGNGGFYLARYSWSRVLREEDHELRVPHFEMEVSQWDAETAVPDRIFAFASLNLPKGTEVQTYDVSGVMKHREWIGGRPLTSGEQFEKLGGFLRKRGFGRVPDK